MSKSSHAFRTIREVADWLDVAAHVLRFWESKFSQIKPVKRAGGRRYYRPSDMELVGGIKVLLHDRGMTIRGVQKMLKEDGIAAVAALSPPMEGKHGATGADEPAIEGDVTAAEWVADADADAAQAQADAAAAHAPEPAATPQPADAETGPKPKPAARRPVVDNDAQASLPFDMPPQKEEQHAAEMPPAPAEDVQAEAAPDDTTSENKAEETAAQNEAAAAPPAPNDDPEDADDEALTDPLPCDLLPQLAAISERMAALPAADRPDLSAQVAALRALTGRMQANPPNSAP